MISIDTVSAADLFDRTRELARARQTPAFASVAEAYKRANNIVETARRSSPDKDILRGQHADRLHEPAELQLKQQLLRVGAEIDAALAGRQPGRALSAVASIQPELARFFDESYESWWTMTKSFSRRGSRC